MAMDDRIARMPDGAQRAIVTGGSSGIGEQIVLALQSQGATVTVLDVNPPGAASTAAYVACDVADEPSVAAAVAAAALQMGGLDLAFLNAGIGGVGGVLDLSAADWDRMQAVDLRGVFLTLRESAKAMIAGGGGSIVVTSSICGDLADRRMSHYNAAKAGAKALARVAAAELGPRGVRVNVIQPGVTATPMVATTEDTLPGYGAAVASRTPLGGLGDPAHVAQAAVALSGLVWVTGQVLAADGGVSLYSPIDLEEFLPDEARPWTAEAGSVQRVGSSSRR
jgi:NAD(P)-dependent dehydrogenase (short-subunit alcohol dehydrogenase family)